MRNAKNDTIGRLFFFVFVALFSFHYAGAQTGTAKPDASGAVGLVSKPRDLKILSEHKDKAGNIFRVIRYKQGDMIVTQTVIIPKLGLAGIYVPIRTDTMKKDSLYVIVDKKKYCLQVMYRRKLIRSYRAVFGPTPLIDKKCEGDRCTPEGWYKIATKNAASKYNKFMGLNYPNDSAYARFNKLKQIGQLPASANIGGSVGIHGIWPGGDDMIEMGVGWTDGCIALRNKDADDLFALVSVGTRVWVRK